MKLQEKYVTDRLLIRKPILNDAQEVFEKFAKCADATKYLTWTSHSHKDETEKLNKEGITHWDNGECFPFTICLKDSEEIIGMLEASISDYKAEFGYVLAKAYWKKGYMSEALEPIKEALLQSDNIYRVWAVCDLENYGSKRVMEKIGMNYEGILKKWTLHPNVSRIPRDCFVYSIVKEK
jgi:RimJ/RimL family protein N-acetyltransferase